MDFVVLNTKDSPKSPDNSSLLNNKQSDVNNESLVEVKQTESKSNLEIIDLVEQKPENCLKTNSLDENFVKIDDSSVVIVSDNDDTSCKEIQIDSNLKTGETVNLLDECYNKSGNSCITINFRDETIANLYKQKLMDFLNNFIEFEVKFSDRLSINIDLDPSLKSDEWSVIDYSEISPDTPLKKHKKKSKAKKELFVVDTTPSLAESNDLRYTSKFCINEDKEEVRLQTCFNCDGNHSLKDCRYPRNYEKINAARQRQKQTKSRYHLEEEQKFSHLMPGKISSELRHALGLRKHELPPFIYFMRRIGYPPGWLEEAKTEHSNLEMFDIDGNNVRASKGKKRALDEAKIVDFPGFNIPLEEGSKDNFKDYGVPPYSDNFSKEAMIDYFNKQCAAKEDDLETCDMEIEENGVENTKKFVEKEHLKEVARDSPSLIDLEQEKRKLLEELNESVQLESVKIVKTTSFGTPILKSNLPFMKLPNPDNFSKDVSPVINFENLPNSTGKYEQMTDVLKKVRTTMKNIQNT